jgi:hypothetical protein
MPKGPQGQKRPADVIGNAVKVMRIATGEEEEAWRDRQKGSESTVAEKLSLFQFERKRPC